MKLQELPVLMQRGSVRRLTACVTAKGLIVRAPTRMSERQVETWLQQIRPKLERRLARTPFHLIHVPREMSEGNSVRLLDTYFQIACEEKPRSFVRVLADTIYLKGPSDLKRKRALERWCIRCLYEEAEPLAQTFAKQLNVSFEKLLIRTYRSRLGACSSDGRLQLHWGIIFLPRVYREAIIAHEVAHIRAPHHQADFWKTVEELAPGAHALHSDLRKIGPFLFF